MADRPRRPTSAELIAAVLDEGSWVSWDEEPLEVAAPGSDYAHALAAARSVEPERVVLVTGHGGDAVVTAAEAFAPGIAVASSSTVRQSAAASSSATIGGAATVRVPRANWCSTRPSGCQ